MSRASCPSACLSCAWKGLGSISASSSPWRTSCPSPKCTLSSWPSTRLRTVTVLSAVTEPRAVRETGRSPARAAAVTTGVARGPGAAEAPPVFRPGGPLPGRVSAYAPPARTQPMITTTTHVRAERRITPRIPQAAAYVAVPHPVPVRRNRMKAIEFSAFAVRQSVCFRDRQGPIAVQRSSHTMRLVRPLVALAVCVSALVAASADPAAAQFTIGGDPRVNPADFRITTFASGLNFPNGLARLSDGSILVATSNPMGRGTYWASAGELLRFTDTNNDGIADGPGQLMYSDPVGVWTGLAVTGNMVFIMSAKDGANRIIVLKMNNGPASPYTFVGTLNFTFPGIWEHKAYAMTTRPAPGASAGTWELYFNVGSSANADQNSDTVGLSGLLTGTMQGGSIYRVTVTEVGLGATVSSLVRIAAGLRNAAGMAFHPTTGDLYFEDNGIDGFQDPNEPLSADELNRIAAADLGRQPVPDFGFPNDYIDYHTGQRVGSGGVQPLVAF